MESFARPMRRLQEEAAWFSRAVEIKLFHVTTDASLRGAVLDMVMAQEHHADNRGLFFRFDDPLAGPDRGWLARVRRLHQQLSEKTESIKPAGIHLRPLADGGGAGRGTSAEFASRLMKMADILVPPLDRMVVVLAPVRVEDPALFVQEMTAFLASPHLGHVRWIVVEADGPALLPLTERMGPAALSCSAAIDEGAAKDDLVSMGAAKVSDPVLLVPPLGAWRAPGAMPDVKPPPRAGSSSPPPDAELRAAGLSPKFINGGGDMLKRLLLGGALAMREGKPAEAVTLQTRAAALCADMEMPREHVINLHVLGGYLLAASQRERAHDIYVKAGDVARAHGLVDSEAQCELALGMLEAVDHRPAQAATHYSAAARLAETAKIEPLALECWRMAGQLALDAKLETSAVECWKRALALADTLDAKLAKSTSAPEIARALAAVCRKRGLIPQARSLEERSFELEHGLEPGAALAGKAAS